VLRKQDDAVLELALDPAKAPLLTRERETTLREALAAALGRPVKLRIEITEVAGESPAAREARLAARKQAEAEAAIMADPTVQSIIEAFDGQVKTETVQPTD